MVVESWPRFKSFETVIRFCKYLIFWPIQYTHFSRLVTRALGLNARGPINACGPRLNMHPRLAFCFDHYCVFVSTLIDTLKSFFVSITIDTKWLFWNSTQSIQKLTLHAPQYSGASCSGLLDRSVNKNRNHMRDHQNEVLNLYVVQRQLVTAVLSQNLSSCAVTPVVVALSNLWIGAAHQGPNCLSSLRNLWI